MICYKCNNDLEENANFCSTCGEAVVRQEEAPPFRPFQFSPSIGLYWTHGGFVSVKKPESLKEEGA